MAKLVFGKGGPLDAARSAPADGRPGPLADNESGYLIHREGGGTFGVFARICFGPGGSSSMARPVASGAPSEDAAMDAAAAYAEANPGACSLDGPDDAAPVEEGAPAGRYNEFAPKAVAFIRDFRASEADAEDYADAALFAGLCAASAFLADLVAEAAEEGEAIDAEAARDSLEDFISNAADPLTAAPHIGPRFLSLLDGD